MKHVIFAALFAVVALGGATALASGDDGSTLELAPASVQHDATVANDTILPLEIAKAVQVHGVWEVSNTKLERYLRQLTDRKITAYEFRGYVLDLDALAKMEALKQQVERSHEHAWLHARVEYVQLLRSHDLPLDTTEPPNESAFVDRVPAIQLRF